MYWWRYISLLLGVLSAHPVHSQDFLPAVSTRDIPRLQRATAVVRSMDEAQLIALVPTQSGLHYVGCPNCSGGRQENQLAWTPERPDEVYCRFCGHRYPSEQYPVTGVVKVHNPRGEQVEFKYWQADDGYRFYFQAHRDDECREYLAQRTKDLAQLYAATQDRAYARRAAVLLDRFAEVFPGWCYHYDYPFHQKLIFDGDVSPEQFRAGYRTARWTWWAYSDIPSPLVQAYALIRDSQIFEELSLERGVDVAVRIERDLFRSAGEQVLANPEPLTNMSPRAWQSLVELGRVIGEPRYVHEVVRRLERMMESQFFYDGSWSEGSPDYASQTIGGLEKVLGTLQGYSDPPGYLDAVDGGRFDSLDLESRVGALRVARSTLKRLHLPNGRSVPVHDTWSTSQREPSESTRAYLLPALGHACLGGGSGDLQTQFHLTWSGGYGHAHADNLSLLLFAYGRELLSDLGYTHTAYRAWTLATAAHNTVVIDGQNQAHGGLQKPSDGSLLFFDPADSRVQIVSAEGARGYPGLATTYRRTLVVVDAGAERRYAVDVFDVAGGHTHDYFLHGDADEATTLTAELELAPLATLLPQGMDWKATRNEGEARRAAEPYYAYGFLSQLQASAVALEHSVACTFRDSLGVGPGTKVTLLPEANCELITGVDPAIRPAAENDAQLDQFHRPFLLLRHAATDGQSRFVSVLEPYSGTPFLNSIERIPLAGGGVAVRVDLGDRTDIVVVGAAEPVTLSVGLQPIVFQGEYGVMSMRGDRVEHAYAVGPGGWTRADYHLSASGPHTVPLRAVEGETLIANSSDATPPEPGDVLQVVTADGWIYPYHVVVAESRGDELRIGLVEDPGFTFDGAEQIVRFRTFPQREHRGEVQVKWYPPADKPALPKRLSE